AARAGMALLGSRRAGRAARQPLQHASRGAPRRRPVAVTFGIAARPPDGAPRTRGSNRRRRYALAGPQPGAGTVPPARAARRRPPNAPGPPGDEADGGRPRPPGRSQAAAEPPQAPADPSP